MAQIKKFDFSKYDSGGINTNANDNKLTGDEAINARNDGWTVWDGFRQEDSELAEYVENSDYSRGQIELTVKTLFNSQKTDSYKQYEKRVNEILAEILEEYGIVLTEEDYFGASRFSDLHFDSRYISALRRAKDQAKQELNFSDNVFGLETNIWSDNIGNNHSFWDPGFGGNGSGVQVGPHFPGRDPIVGRPHFPIEDIPWRIGKPWVPNYPIGGIGSGWLPVVIPPGDEELPPEEQPWDDVPGEETPPPPGQDDDDWNNGQDGEPEEPVAPSNPTSPTQPTPPPAPVGGNEVGEVKYHAPTSNSTRKQSTTNGTFCAGWIEEDAYGSETYEEWLRNNGYEYDASAAKKLRDECAKNAKDHSLEHYCGRAFRLAAQKLGLWENMENQRHAYQFASELANNPNFKELPNNIVATMDLRKLPPGCVIIYDAGYKSDGKNVSGHVGVTTGNGTEYGGYCPRSGREDGSISISQQRKADHIRVFIPIVRK